MTSRPEIDRALRYVADHLGQSMTVAEIARAAHLSEFHLHRVFHAEVGESIGRFITRRRLETAALRLAYEPDVPITSIALASGYSSSSNFSKAFSAYFGCSPSLVRAPAGELPGAVGRLTSCYGKDFNPRDLYALPSGSDPQELAEEASRWDACVRYEDCDGRAFACLASPGGYELETITETWAGLIPRARQLGLCGEDVDAWGVSHDSPVLTAPELCRYHACIPCSRDASLPPPLFLGGMQPGRYAVFHYDGAVSGVEGAYRSIYSCWFGQSSLAPADFVPLDHYVEDAPQDGYVEMEMWFRVRPRAEL